MVRVFDAARFGRKAGDADSESSNPSYLRSSSSENNHVPMVNKVVVSDSDGRFAGAQYRLPFSAVLCIAVPSSDLKPISDAPQRGVLLNQKGTDYKYSVCLIRSMIMRRPLPTIDRASSCHDPLLE